MRGNNLIVENDHLYDMDLVYPMWLRVCRNWRNLEAFQKALIGVDVNAFVGGYNPLVEAVNEDWIDGVAWLLSHGTSLLYHPQRVMANTQSVAMIRLLGLRVNSPTNNPRHRSCTRLEMLLFNTPPDAFERAFAIDLIDAGARLPILPPYWLQRIVDGRECCRHITLWLMSKSRYDVNVMRLIAREVWATRLDTDAWMPLA
jgi:hypothetical protein